MNVNLPKISKKELVLILAGNIVLAFGLYNIHAQTEITEGGVLGLSLLVKYWFSISPAYSGIVFNIICYAIGIKVLGKRFLVNSAVATLSFSVFYKIFEAFPPLWPRLYMYPLAASVIGALFIGIGAGISVRAGGASGGDDAIAMAFSKVFGKPISFIYLLDDIVVLLFSLTYIPAGKIMYSLLTVVLSGQILELVQKFGTKRTKEIKQDRHI